MKQHGRSIRSSATTTCFISQERSEHSSSHSALWFRAPLDAFPRATEPEVCRADKIPVTPFPSHSLRMILTRLSVCRRVQYVPFRASLSHRDGSCLPTPARILLAVSLKACDGAQMIEKLVAVVTHCPPHTCRPYWLPKWLFRAS